MRVGALVLLASFALAFPGCAQPPAPMPGSESTGRVQLPPELADFFELNLRVEEGARIDYDWETDPPTAVRFNVHYHEGGRAVDLERSTSTNRTSAFTSPIDGIVSLLWENPGPGRVDLLYGVSGRFLKDSAHEPA